MTTIFTKRFQELSFIDQFKVVDATLGDLRNAYRHAADARSRRNFARMIRRIEKRWEAMLEEVAA